MKKATLKDLAPIAIPHGPPVESVSEYFRSKMEDGQIRKYPVWDIARPTPEVLVEHARRELSEAESELAAARVRDEENRREMDAKWADLREKELLLRQSFISFNKFIRENQEKRERAERQMREDQQSLERKTRETEAMRARVNEMEEIKEQMERQVRDYTKYEDYLMSVVNRYPEFKQPLDILHRYEALAAAKSSLAARQERDLETLEAARVEMSKQTEAKRLVIMGLNNELASLRLKYDKARQRTLKWNLALTRIKDTAATRMNELTQVRDSVWTLYLKICERKGLDVTAKQEDYESQLVVIMRALIELRKILDIAKQRVQQRQPE